MAQTGQRWYRMRPMELATSWVYGFGVAPEVPYRGGSAKAVLERVLLAALQRSPCVVAFSGGRDSSAVLALGVELARRHGLAPPVPATRVFAGDAQADEAAWQERVIAHLRLDDWVRVRLGGECDLIGPYARPLLRHHGVLWPPTAHVNIPLLRVARGGSLVTGEGGDEVFGPRRATPVRHLMGGTRRRRAAYGWLPRTLGPTALRAVHERRALRRSTTVPWLRPDAQRAHLGRLVRDSVAEPFSWRASTVHLLRRRAWVHGAATMRRVAGMHDVDLVHPLLHPRFVGALAATGSRLGPMTRAAALRELFGEVVPADVIRRTSKAYFNSALFGAGSRAFAASWSGGGVDERLIDPDALRKAWLEPFPHAGTFALLQAAWLSASGLPLTGGPEQPRP